MPCHPDCGPLVAFNSDGQHAHDHPLDGRCWHDNEDDTPDQQEWERKPMKFKIHVAQEFSNTYIVEADVLEDAWMKLMSGEGECVEQVPEQITSTIATSGIEVQNADGDWEDV